MKRLITYTAVVLATLLTLQILWQFRLVLVLFVLSLFAAAAIRPFVTRIAGWGVSKPVAQVLLYGVGIGGIVIILLLLGDLLLLQLNSAANQAIIEYELLVRKWELGPAWQQTAVARLPPPFTSAAAEDMELEQMLPAIVNITQSVTSAVGSLLLLLVLSAYWSADQYRFERLWLSLLSTKRRAYARDIWREIELSVGSYLRSQTAQSILAALFLGVGAAAAGVSYPLLLAFSGAVAAFIPLFGGLVAAIAAFVLGNLDSSWVGVGTAVYTLIVFLGLEFVVEPRLWARERRTFLLTILVIIPLLELFGVWGLIAAPPLAAAIEVLIKQAYQAYVVRQDTAVKLDDLEARYQHLSQKITDAAGETVTPELQNLQQRLADLLSTSHDMNTT